MADAVNAMGYRYVALNPGASFRGLHDSLVNYSGNRPELIQCLHENVAVGIAHGYAKASGEPMAVILHNVVGLLHGAMAIYYAYIDRVPMMILGGAGPMALDKRRANIDWIHSANVQGNAVRDYTKWDDQPASIKSIAPTVARGHRVAMIEPQGPVYIAMDGALQEQRLTEPVEYPNFERFAVPSSIGADEKALAALARMLMDARRPVIIPGYAGRSPEAFGLLVELAELAGAGVVDSHHRLNFPNRHPLNAEGTAALGEADLVLFLDVKDMERPTKTTDYTTRKITSRLAPDVKIADLGYNDLAISSWTHDFASLEEVDLQVTADTTVALPRLLELSREIAAEENPARRAEREAQAARIGKMHEETWAGWQRDAERVWDATPISTARLAAEVWDAVKDHDWVLAPGTASEWAYRIWDFDRPYRHVGKTLGTGTQIAISIGTALAHRDAGRLVVDLQPDGDLLFDPQALWTAAYHQIPMLVVMFNNRAYYNDWLHQERMANVRGTPVENAYLGMEIDKPAPDFANLARSFGWHGEGPVTDPADLGAAVRRAVDVVMKERRPALVDVVCQYQ
ncbi:thiamine pyrophosphate-binding protein [Actinomadura sp.]|jgi:benzoylformate decarboxylase/acetolactate synthase-1/2/3 large subunit|uniref:thiamine pyrophosphate-binding protein n=1 Tax=Actinomadura sp. TaxID=1989 RepID=UPI0037C63096